MKILKDLMKWSLLAISMVVAMGGCSDDNSPTDKPIEDDPYEGLKDVVFTSEDDLILYTVVFADLAADDYVKEYKLEEGETVEFKNNGDKTGEIIFRTDDFNIASLENINGEYMVAMPTFFGFGEEIRIPVAIDYNSISKIYKMDGEVEINGNMISVSLEMGESKANAKLGYQFGIKNKFAGLPWFYDKECLGVQLAPVRGEGLHYESSPYILSWDSSTYPEDIKNKIAPDDFLQILLNTPFLDEKEYGFDRADSHPISIGQLLGRLGGLFTFYQNEDNPTPYIYFNSIAKSKTSGYESVGSRKCFAISNTSESSLLLCINPKQFFNIKVPAEDYATSGKYYSTDNEKVNALLANLLLALSPLNAEGVPMQYKSETDVTENSGSMPVYSSRMELWFSDTGVSRVVMRNLLDAVFYEETDRQRLLAAFEADPATAPYSEDLKYLVDNINNLLLNTIDMKFGFVFYNNSGEDMNSLLEGMYKYLYD